MAATLILHKKWNLIIHLDIFKLDLYDFEFNLKLK